MKQETDVNASPPQGQKDVSLLSDDELNGQVHLLSGAFGRTAFILKPDYCNDLNAMHKAEKMLKVEQAINFRFFLSENSGKRNTKFPTVESAMCHATARQRAEAFMKTMKG